jgi:hydrophobic/amphiphilic exporter-1 (mainly G- bacteria), HAE1 family
VSLPQKIVARPILITVVFALVIVVGLFVLNSVPIDLFPANESLIVMVRTTWTGNGPETVENLVTRVLERSLSGVQGLSAMTSNSSEGSSFIRMEFAYGTNLDAAVNSIRDKLDSVRRSLPDDVDAPTINRFDSSSFPIMRLVMRGARTVEELREIADQLVQPRLEQAAGVASVGVSGGRAAIVRADISQNRLEAYGLTISGIATALAAQNVQLGAGSMAEGGVTYTLKTTGDFRSVDEIAGAVIASRNGRGIRLADVAEVSRGWEDQTSFVEINGESGVSISVRKESGSNSVKVADAVYAKMGELQRILPPGVSLEILSDDTTLIRSTIRDLLVSALEGAGLAMAFVFIFIRSIRPTIVIGLSIPISLVVTMLAMYFAGITLNMMTLTGLILGVGMIIDSSIVILDNIQQYRDRGAKATVASVLGTKEMLAPISASNLTTIVVFVPMLMYSRQIGMIGIMFRGAIFTIVISLVASWIVAVFLVPVLSSRYLPVVTRAEHPIRSRLLRAVDTGFARALDGLNRGYRAALTAALNHRAATILIVLALLALSLAFTPRMNIVFAPPMTDDSITVSAALPLGTTLEETRDVIEQLAAAAQTEVRGIKNMIVTAGESSGFRFGADSSNAGSINITMRDEGEKPDSAMVVREKLRAHFADYPQATFAFSEGRFRIGRRGDIDIAVRSTDFALVMATAKGIRGLIRQKVPQALEPTLDTEEGLPQIGITINRERAYGYGLTVAQIAREIRANVYGTTATTYHEGGKDYDVVLRLVQTDRQKMPDLERIFVVSPSGARIPLADVARLEKGTGPVSISRENQARAVHVRASLAGNVRADAVEASIRKAIAENLVVDENASLEYMGSWSEVSSTSRTFLLVLVLAILLVFGVMAGQYESFRDPLINLFTIPLMAIGVILVHAVTKNAFSMFTLVGLVMLVGIVVNNGIILVDYINLLRKRGVPLKQACIEGGANRLRPVLMTAISAILGVVPMALFPSENASIMQPIGLAVMGGLASSTFITLLIIPVLYSLFNRNGEPKRRKEARA